MTIIAADYTTGFISEDSMKSDDWKQGRLADVDSFWDQQLIINLPYARERFNDEAQLAAWQGLGHQPRTGALFDMRQPNQPGTTQRLIDWVDRLENIGVSYYRMEPGDNLPYHRDTYKRYINLFNLHTRAHKIWRYIFFVEDWRPGHIFEIDGHPLTDWRSGDWVAWRYDVPHMAANLGDEPRFTIQLTGVEIEGI